MDAYTNCESGAHADSTRARLLAVSDSVDISSALASLSSKNLNKRKFFRMIPTLQYLSDLGIHISEAPPSNPSPLVLVDLLDQSPKPRGLQAFRYRLHGWFHSGSQQKSQFGV